MKLARDLFVYGFLFYIGTRMGVGLIGYILAHAAMVYFGTMILCGSIASTYHMLQTDEAYKWYTTLPSKHLIFVVLRCGTTYANVLVPIILIMIFGFNYFTSGQ